MNDNQRADDELYAMESKPYTRLSENERVKILSADAAQTKSARMTAFEDAKARYQAMNPLNRMIQTMVGKVPNKSWWIARQKAHLFDEKNQGDNPSLQSTMGGEPLSLDGKPLILGESRTDVVDLQAIASKTTKVGDFSPTAELETDPSLGISQEEAESAWRKR